MRTTTIPGFIHAKPAHDWEMDMDDVVDGHRIVFSICRDMSASGYVVVCPYTVEFEMPEGWDPRAQQIEALKQKKEALHREFSAAVVKINQQIANLQAITYEAPA